MAALEYISEERRGGRAKYVEADQLIRQLPYIKLDPDSVPLSGSTFYLMDNGAQVVEIQLTESPVQVSCRFTLCHPPSVDSVFLGLIRELMRRLGMEARIC